MIIAKLLDTFSTEPSITVGIVRGEYVCRFCRITVGTSHSDYYAMRKLAKTLKGGCLKTPKEADGSRLPFVNGAPVFDDNSRRYLEHFAPEVLRICDAACRDAAQKKVDVGEILRKSIAAAEAAQAAEEAAQAEHAKRSDAAKKAAATRAARKAGQPIGQLLAA